MKGEAQENSLARATSDITAFSIKFNGAPLPLGLENVKEFFPKATVTLEPSGKVVANTAPDRDLPVRLPGLDPKRLPDISFLPVELPQEALEQGRAWTFERSFSGAPLKYTCNVSGVSDGLAVIKVDLSQDLTALENDALETVKDEKDAVAKVASTLKGEGRVWFSIDKGRALGADVSYTTDSTVTPLKGGEAKKRKLKTMLKIRQPGFEPPAESSVAAIKTGSRLPARPRSAGDWLRWSWDSAVSWWSGASEWAGGMRMVLAIALSQVPFFGEGAARLLMPGRP